VRPSTDTPRRPAATEREEAEAGAMRDESDDEPTMNSMLPRWRIATVVVSVE